MQGFHEPLKVLSLAKALLADIYSLLAGPDFDRHHALRDQLARASLSVTSNIAEGDGRPTAKDGARFFGIAIASAEEVKVQVELAANIGLIPDKKAIELYEGYSRVCRMLRRLSEVRLRRIE
jgi:four helix bundle protein